MPLPRRSSADGRRFSALVRWVNAAGARGESRIALTQLPAPFARFSHPEVANGQELLVEAMTVSGREALLDLGPVRRPSGGN